MDRNWNESFYICLFVGVSSCCCWKPIHDLFVRFSALPSCISSMLFSEGRVFVSAQRFPVFISIFFCLALCWVLPFAFVLGSAGIKSIVFIVLFLTLSQRVAGRWCTLHSESPGRTRPSQRVANPIGTIPIKGHGVGGVSVMDNWSIDFLGAETWEWEEHRRISISRVHCLSSASPSHKKASFIECLALFNAKRFASLISVLLHLRCAVDRFRPQHARGTLTSVLQSPQGFRTPDDTPVASGPGHLNSSENVSKEFKMSGKSLENPSETFSRRFGLRPWEIFFRRSLAFRTQRA